MANGIGILRYFGGCARRGDVMHEGGQKMKRVMIAISAACWKRALAATDNIVKQLHVDAQARSAELPIPEAVGMYGFWLRAVGYKKAVIAFYFAADTRESKSAPLKMERFLCEQNFR